MVFAIGRLIVLGFIAMTVLYVLVSLYSRSVRREKLEKRWEDEGRPGDRAAYVEAGMEKYAGSFRRKLILSIYVVPMIVLIVVIYLTNFY